ncbi:Hint domain-containing protein [Sedimentitalea sp. JM2-8]|uniref:Hint domain-containing protein n=1 Tax=Sedimentitalea xiamensis TaxID=3050037 RepID=A0ABT7FGN9_9RHOB|nr:Hint domain-containing protein [Sedimentitalea xiamensis]MDK3074305.1 Hint domain-containing protein [Sedimentitalea xiamensis]
MATFDYSSIIEFSRNGNSLEFHNGGSADFSGTLDDGEADNTFETDDTFTFTTPGAGLTNFPSGTEITLNFEGAYTTGGASYVVLVWPDNTDYGFLFSPTDAASTDSNLANTISTTDLAFGNGDFTTCFAAGTLIATPEGECAVETLAIGDLVTTAEGGIVPVKWIGRQTVHKLFTSAERFAPVRVSAGALGNGLPHTDLVLTAEHALILDGLAINAGALVNGTTIAYDPIDSLPERVTYYHIETEKHDVILANGAPAETYVDYIGRRVFDNFAEYESLYGEEQAITEMPLPRVSAARLVPPAIRARLATSDAA